MSDKRFELVKRGTVEIIEEDELKRLLREKKKPIVYHGFEPSGKMHIGYIIGINKLIDFSNAGFKVIILFADLHAWLNEKGSLEEIKKNAKVYEKSFRALGLKNFKTVLGSSFQLKEEYVKDVLKLSLMIRMKRARRAMTIVGREEENPHIAQVLYPLMQVVDIKALNVDVAFGDEAQRKIHMLARENLPNIGFKRPIAIHHVDMVGLTGGKMSCSLPESCILLDESSVNVRKKILNAFCPAKQIKDNPILQICEYILFTKLKKFKVERIKKFGGDLEFEHYKDLEKTFSSGGLHPQDLKESVARELIKILEPIRKKLR